MDMIRRALSQDGFEEVIVRSEAFDVCCVRSRKKYNGMFDFDGHDEHYARRSSRERIHIEVRW